MIGIVAALLVATASGAPAEPPANPSASASATATTGVAMREEGLVGTWFPPAGGKRGPALLVLGGSEGGQESAKRLAEKFAGEGYGALALAYFRADGLPAKLQNIPLEYFDRAAAWLARQPLCDPRRMGLYGVSIGGETALLVATRHPEFRAVVAVVPSSVVWQGFDPANYLSVESSYSLGGKGISYLPYDTSAPFTGVYALYASSLKQLPAHPEAIIPVEKIGGALLLLSAKSDSLWPSSEMADQVMARLEQRHFARPHRHLAFADAGHGAARPPGPGPQRDGPYDNLGGTEAGNAAARAGMWQATLSFLAEQLKPERGGR